MDDGIPEFGVCIEIESKTPRV